jgi:hypothetical protein
MSRTTELEWEVTLPLTIDFDYEPFVPAKISGPPEHCYPAEGGTVSINDVFLGTISIMAFIPQAELEHIQQHILEMRCDEDAEGPCDAPDPEPDYDH